MSAVVYKTALASVANLIMPDKNLHLLSSVSKLVFDEHSKVNECSIRVLNIAVLK